MKLLHRPNLFGWSRFDEARNIDFHSVLWTRPAGNVAIDPLPLSDHERRRLNELGGVRKIVITNSDHTRAALELREATGAELYGPFAERGSFPVRCDAWLDTGAEVLEGLTVMALHGSKTAGELALVIEGTTLVTGDLIRAHRGGALDLLPAAKLSDPREARLSLRRLSSIEGIDAVLPGDGWPVFRDGRRALEELLASLEESSPLLTAPA
jgi:hypothetical protein